MSRLTSWLAPTTTARAHCDLPCGVYDPEQARIEAESDHRINEKYAASEDATFRTRAIAIKEKQADLVKHHLDVLWHDYFTLGRGTHPGVSGGAWKCPSHAQACQTRGDWVWTGAPAGAKPASRVRGPASRVSSRG